MVIQTFRKESQPLETIGPSRRALLVIEAVALQEFQTSAVKQHWELEGSRPEL